jgi:hypothetical protein
MVYDISISSETFFKVQELLDLIDEPLTYDEIIFRLAKGMIDGINDDLAAFRAMVKR